jgi:hypothetical protein
MQLPKKGLITFKEKIFQMLKDFEKYDINWNDGRLFGYIFDPGKNIVILQKKHYYNIIIKVGWTLRFIQVC